MPQADWQVLYKRWADSDSRISFGGIRSFFTNTDWIHTDYCVLIRVTMYVIAVTPQPHFYFYISALTLSVEYECGTDIAKYCYRRIFVLHTPCPNVSADLRRSSRVAILNINWRGRFGDKLRCQFASWTRQRNGRPITSTSRFTVVNREKMHTKTIVIFD